MIITKFIKYNSKEYAQELDLRNKILREPIGKKLDLSDTLDDDRQIHIGAFLENNVIGCIIIAPLESKAVAKLRQMAVSSSMQGNGVGRKLMIAAESFLKEEGYSIIELSARITAEEFYKKLGYKTVGNIFYEHNMQHIKMIKVI